MALRYSSNFSEWASFHLPKNASIGWRVELTLTRKVQVRIKDGIRDKFIDECKTVDNSNQRSLSVIVLSLNTYTRVKSY